MRQTKSHPRIQQKCHLHFGAGVERYDGRSITPRPRDAFFGQGAADAAAAGSPIDDEHPDDRPRLLEEGSFGSPGRNKGDSPDLFADPAPRQRFHRCRPA